MGIGAVGRKTISISIVSTQECLLDPNSPAPSHFFLTKKAMKSVSNPEQFISETCKFPNGKPLLCWSFSPQAKKEREEQLKTH